MSVFKNDMNFGKIDLWKFLPNEIIVQVCSNLTLRKIVQLKRVSKDFSRIIDLNLDEIAYTISDASNVGLYVEVKDSMYSNYERGKIYYAARPNNDIKWILRDSDHILSFMRFKIHGDYGCDEAINIITIDINYRYNVYYFHPVVDTLHEYTPDYYGWDNDDLGLRALKYEASYNNLNDVLKFLTIESASNEHFIDILNSLLFSEPEKFIKTVLSSFGT